MFQQGTLLVDIIKWKSISLVIYAVKMPELCIVISRSIFIILLWITPIFWTAQYVPVEHSANLRLNDLFSGIAFSKYPRTLKNFRRAGIVDRIFCIEVAILCKRKDTVFYFSSKFSLMLSKNQFV
jgi:hypothetical protein